MAKVNVYANLDDIGLFNVRQKNEVSSQRERARWMVDRFAECMENARCSRGCIMPDLCAHGHALDCAHLTVDYSGFTLKGTRAARTIPLPRNRLSLIDSRFRAIGTLVYREI
jgi:putative N-acetylmannosamine-6-phosphate epimerase